MSETFKTIYERLNNGKRSGNPANIPSLFGNEPETQDWDGNNARRYGAYAEARTFENMSHENALEAMTKRIR
jgi:hypothetical protein